MSVATHEMAAVGAHLNEVYPMLPFTPVRGQGVYLENAAGRRILDLYGGHAVAALEVPAVVDQPTTRAALGDRAQPSVGQPGRCPAATA